MAYGEEPRCGRILSEPRRMNFPPLHVNFTLRLRRVLDSRGPLGERSKPVIFFPVSFLGILTIRPFASDVVYVHSYLTTTLTSKSVVSVVFVKAAFITRKWAFFFTRFWVVVEYEDSGPLWGKTKTEPFSVGDQIFGNAFSSFSLVFGPSFFFPEWNSF